MSDKHVRFSIVTPSYNQGEHLEKTILSVLDQGYPNLEYIIIDGGSTDKSVEVIRKYEKRLKYWVSEKDRGQSHAINRGFEHATGDLLGWLNSDDFYAPGALRTVAGVYGADPTVGAIVGAGDMVDESGIMLRRDPPFEVSVEVLYHWVHRHFWQPSCFFTRAAWAACGPLNEKYHFAMDLDLWFKIAEKFPFATTPALLSTSLLHENAKTAAYTEQTRIDAAFVISAHGGEKEARQYLLNHMNDKDQRVEYLERRIQGILSSYSWKLTAPIRLIARGRILSKARSISAFWAELGGFS
jgi:glycosyltransferase involved in cell wall biosynthesis